MSDAKQRPTQVTVSASLIIGGSVLLLLVAYDQIVNLRSLEQRTMVERMLSEPPLAGLGLGIEPVLEGIRIAAMVAGGCAAATAILGYQVLKRDRLARLVLTILAAPVFLAGLATGGFVSSVVVVSVIMLWTQPSRDWFDGRPAPDLGAQHPSGRRARPAPPRSSSQVPPQVPPQVRSQVPPQARSRISTGAGAPALTVPAAARAAGAAGATGATGAPARPGAVLWACVLTWVSTGVTGVMLLASTIVVAARPDELLAEVTREYPELAGQGVTADLLVSSAYFVAGAGLAWCAAAAVVAVFAFRRRPWARLTLLSTAAVAGLLALLASASSVLFVVPLVACAVTFSILLRPEVRGWYAAPLPPRPGPPRARGPWD